jgi:hypothetical protein
MRLRGNSWFLHANLRRRGRVRQSGVACESYYCREACVPRLSVCAARLPARPQARGSEHAKSPGRVLRSPGLSVLMRMIAPFRSMMPQERNQDDDRNGNSNQPKQHSSSESHVDVLRLACAHAGSRTNVCRTKAFRPRTFGVGGLRRRLPEQKGPRRRLSVALRRSSWTGIGYQEIGSR